MAESNWVGVVDDDASIRRSLARVFRGNGIRVATFASAEEYLQRTVAGEPGCVILDVHLGAMSGFDLQDCLASEGNPPPIIFITAHDDVPPARLRARGGASAHLRKPFCTYLLLALVRRHLQRDPSNGSEP